MANNADTQSQQEFRVGYAKQTTWGTAVLDAAAFTVLDCELPHIDRDVKVIENNCYRSTQSEIESSRIIHTNEAMPKFTIDLIVKREELADWLYAYFQNVAEAGTTPYGKTFTMLASSPNFQVDTTAFYTFIIRDPGSSLSYKIVDCVLKKLAFTWAKGDVLRASMDWIARGLPSVVANPSGTWSANAPDNLYHWGQIDRITANLGGGNVNFSLEELTVNLEREITHHGPDGSGSFLGYHFGKPSLSASMKVLKDSDFHTWLSNHAAQTAVDVNVGLGNATPGTVNGDLDFAMHGIIHEQPSIEFGEPTLAVCPFALVESDNLTTQAITVIMADAVDKSWPA